MEAAWVKSVTPTIGRRRGLFCKSNQFGAGVCVRVMVEAVRMTMGVAADRHVRMTRSRLTILLQAPHTASGGTAG